MTTLNQIRSHKPCAEGWTKLLKHLNKTTADDEPLSLITILNSNGLDDAIWCLRTEPTPERIQRFALAVARRVEHLSPEAKTCNETTQRYLNGTATKAELVDAARAAADAAEAAYATRAAAYATEAAEHAARAARAYATEAAERAPACAAYATYATEAAEHAARAEAAERAPACATYATYATYAAAYATRAEAAERAAQTQIFKEIFE